MLKFLFELFDESAPDLKARLVAVYGVLTVLNLGAWLWALVAFHDRPALLIVALTIYGLGLRHAVDADHVAAIDNITRKLMQDGRRPVSVGFWFALGHSTVVIVVAGLVAGAATMLGRFQSLQSVGGFVSTLASAFFLFAVALMNILIFVSIYQSYKLVRSGKLFVEEDLEVVLEQRGILARIFRPVFRLVSRSWHMFPVGFLFGLGFDTAMEVSTFGVSAVQTSKGLPFVAVMVFPVLFAAGMSLVDTSDGVMMLGAYDWAFVKPMRKLYYNMAITLGSIVIALVIGGVEALGLISDQLDLKTGYFWAPVVAMNDRFNDIGFLVIGLFVAAWLVSYVVYKAKELDEVETSI